MTRDLSEVRELVGRESGLAVVVVHRRDGSAVTSVVNAGVIDHPTTGSSVVAFVVRGHARKLQHLRRDRRATIVFRVGWEWIAVEGTVDLVGPRDHLDGVPIDGIPRLLRMVYAAAVGGTAEDWSSLDAEMEAEGHTAALLRPSRIYGSPRDLSP